MTTKEWIADFIAEFRRRGFIIKPLSEVTEDELLNWRRRQNNIRRMLYQVRIQGK